MSKEIAQTVSGSKIAWLLAIVAAFAVLAALATQWQTTKAVAEADVAITVAQVPAGPANIAAGAQVTNTITVLIANNNLLDGIIEINPDDDLTVTQASYALAPSGNTGNCTAIAGGDPNDYQCAVGPLNVGATAVITLVGNAGNDISPFVDGNGDNTAQDGEILVRSGAADATPADEIDTETNLGLLTVIAGTNVAKSNNPATVPQAGGNYVSTITYTSPNEAGVETTALSFTDTITTAGLTVVSPPTLGGTANTGGLTVSCTSANPAGYDLGNIVTTANTQISCTVGSIDAGDITAGETVTLNITTQVPVNPGVPSRTITDTGTWSATAGGIAISASNLQASVTQAGAVLAELRHISDDNEVLLLQEIPDNVRGSRHTACFVDPNTNQGVNVGTNFTVFFDNQNPDAYAGDEAVIPQQPTANDLAKFVQNITWNQGAPTAASCFSWYSTGAGDQVISAEYLSQGNLVTVRWNNDAGAGQQGGLVKEWNVLEDSTVTVTHGTATLNDTIVTGFTGTEVAEETLQEDEVLEITVPLYLNPITGEYNWQGGSWLIIEDIFGGSHLNRGFEDEYFDALAGVSWDISVTSTDSCGVAYYGTNGDDGITTIQSQTAQPGYFIDDNPLVAIMDDGDCFLGSVITVEIVGSEGELGSGDGLIATQEIEITFEIPAPSQKQVFLAWAGQRIILEHDWRIPPGDRAATSGQYPQPVVGSVCPFGNSAQAVFVRGSGPGNFLPGLGATISGNDEARVTVSSPTQQNGTANSHCISRVLYESEDQGQVDIEAFIDGAANNVTKHAFVIYYMKLNTVTTSLVTQAEKPNHNSTSAPDWAGVGTTTSANPWNSSLDDADGAAEWNVSKDILARVRVTGWFLTTNPSGRPADTSNPLNVLPANRWVMPDDWAQLHGGPIDAAGLNETTHNIGTAEEFRSYFDLMFAPNNAQSIALGSPEGLGNGSTLAVAQAGSGTGSATSPIVVNSCADLLPGTLLSTATPALGSVVACSNNLLVVSAPATSPIAAGTLIRSAAGVPFEGPYSLIDIPGLAAQALGGAAVSNFVAGSIRDTILGDSDVDAWDAPMPPAMISLKLRGTGFLKPVLKQDVYYLGSANSTTQTYPNPFYIQNIPDSQFIPAVVVGGGYLWNSWGTDGPGPLTNGQGVYRFWQWALAGTNSAGVGDTLSTADKNELAEIAKFHGTVARDAVVYTDNHGEAMVAANGDFKTDLTACATNALAGGKHCARGDKVGTATITATADYPDFRGKHFPVLSNAVTVDWLWGGYKDVTVHPGETDQFKYVVFHAMDRDGFCSASSATILLHSVLNEATVPVSYTGMTDNDTNFSNAALGSGHNNRYNNDPHETADFLIDSGEGIIIDTNAGSSAGGGAIINDGRQFASNVPTFSVALNNPASSGVLEFPLSPLAAEGQTDECQAWIKVSNSLLGIVNVLTIAHDDEGNIGFDRVIDLSNTMSYTLNFRWSLITWAGADGISVSDAITGTGTGGQNPGGNDISASVTAIYGWDAAAQQWLGYFPSGVNVPGANDLTSLNTGDAYWIAITGPSSVTWTIATNIN